MVPESFFEWCFRGTAVYFTFNVSFVREVCFIDNIDCKLFIVQRTFIWNCTTEPKILLAGTQNLLIMWQYNKFYVFHTTITCFNHFAIEYFVDTMPLWEIFYLRSLLHYWKKSWVKLYYFAITFFFLNFIPPLF